MSRNDEDKSVRISVSPEPGAEELAAISAVVAGLSRLPNGEERATMPAGGGREKWRAAGRREVLRPVDRDDA